MKLNKPTKVFLLALFAPRVRITIVIIFYLFFFHYCVLFDTFLSSFINTLFIHGSKKKTRNII